MKKLLLLAGFLFLFSLIVELFLPFYWGDATFATKVKYYQQHKSSYNALFFGGSLEYRQINNTLLNKALAEDGIDFKSFNLGSDGHGLVQQLDDVKHIIEKQDTTLKYVFLSVSSDVYFVPAFRKLTKGVYWQNLRSTMLSLQILYEMKDSLLKKLIFTRYYLEALFVKYYKLGKMVDVIIYLSNSKKEDTAYLGKYKDGYFSYDQEEYHLGVELGWKDSSLLESKIKYHTDKRLRDSAVALTKLEFQTYTDSFPVNQSMLNAYISTAEKLERRGIKVFFILPPRCRTSYHILLPIHRRLPKDRTIAVADPRAYPELYELSSGYNFYHLNGKGADRYTQILAKKIAALIH